MDRISFVPDSRTAASATRTAIEHAQAGDIEAARRALGTALDADPGYGPAWEWLATLVTEDAERKFCLQRALEAKPDADLRRRLRRLRRVAAAAPAEVSWLVEPPSPPPVAARTTARTSWRWLAAGVVAVLLLAGGVAWLGTRASDAEPVRLAFVAGRSSGESRTVQSMVDAVRLVVDEANEDGGVRGHPIDLAVHDDGNDAGKARECAKEIVRDGRALAVIGHMTSGASAAAAPVYADAGVPAITPTATSDGLVSSSPWYLRTVFGNRVQSEFAATYLHAVLGARRVSVVGEDSEYGRTIREGVVRAFGGIGTVAHDLTVSPAGVGQVVAALRSDPDPGPVVVAAQESLGLELVTALRTAGVTAPVFAADSLADDSFHDALAERLSKQSTAIGEFYAMSPMVADALTGSALRWSRTFAARYGYQPTWHAAMAYDAAVAAVHALRRPDLRLDEKGRPDDRRRVRDAIAAASVDGVLGPIRFDADRSAVRQVSVARSDGKRFVSAPVQYVGYEPRSAESAAADVAAGRAAELGGRVLARRQIVSTGINVNEIRDLDTRDGTYFADFFLWLKYVGDDTAGDVTFLNAVEPGLTPGAEIRRTTTGDTTYRLHRVAAKFKADLDFRAFPFDRQSVKVVLQNRVLPSENVVYVTDRAVLDQSKEDRLRGAADVGAGINQIANWDAEDLHFYRDTVGTTGRLGDPAAATSGGTYYSQYVAEVHLARQIGPFLAKNLLPLVLLVAITYIGLFFPMSSAVGHSIAITAILGAAVLLAAVTAPLPSVSYTVAIEWAYYAFIMLAAAVMLILLLRVQLSARNRDDVAKRLIVGARIGYPAVVAGVVAAYLFTFG